MGRVAEMIQTSPGLLAQMMLAQRGALIGWVPVCLACGIGLYFSVLREPPVVVFLVLTFAMIVLYVVTWHLSEVTSPLAWAIGLVMLGFLIAGMRAHGVGEPVLGWRYYGPVEGRIVAMDRSQSDALRLTLDRVRLDRIPPHRTPDRVRISLHGTAAQGITPEPGLRIMTTAHLSPPSGPVEPGGFDFQRHAWFVRLGAVGYTRVPLMGVAEAREGHAGLRVFRIRMAASARIQEILPGDIGGFAAAITTGDRSAISRDALNDLRASNLAHLLAISGLHMGLLSAFVFAVLRVLLAAHPRIALHWPTKGIAACGALLAACGYLALSGGNVATQRAFIMVAVALGALIIGRRALSLRAVAVAACIVLVLRPEALLGPGFQMSFAATTALVAVFGWLNTTDQNWVPRWAMPVFTVFLSSAVAGLATAPIAAAHFNAIAHYGLIANLLSVPLMGILVIPAAVLGVVLAPLGLDWIGFEIMGWGLAWILGVAGWVAGLDGARGYVAAPGGMVLPLLGFGFLMIVLWQGHLRWSGFAAMALSFVLWSGAERPDVLISDTGSLVGVLSPEGRALSKAKGAGFVARNWLENDGDGASQFDAAGRWQQGAIVHLNGKRAAAAFEGCRVGQVIVASVKLTRPVAADCLTYDPKTLRATGSIALQFSDAGFTVITARARSGERLWTNWPKARTQTKRDQYVRINPTKRP